MLLEPSRRRTAITYDIDAGDRKYGRTLPALLPNLKGHDRRVSGPGVEKFSRSTLPALYSPK